MARRPALVTAGDGDLAVELRWGYTNAGCLCSGVQTAVPDRDDKVQVADGQCAGEVDGVRTSECVHPGELTGILLHGCSELDRARGGPVAFPGLLSHVEIALAEVVISGGGSKCGTHLGIGQAAGYGGVASVPQPGRKLAACLLDQQLHESAGVEVDERHPS